MRYRFIKRRAAGIGKASGEGREKIEIVAFRHIAMRAGEMIVCGLVGMRNAERKPEKGRRNDKKLANGPNVTRAKTKLPGRRGRRLEKEKGFCMGPRGPNSSKEAMTQTISFRGGKSCGGRRGDRGGSRVASFYYRG